jgi:class 3 adenylate cyclase/TolB-like protein/Tfp pilus assembly protein PilF
MSGERVERRLAAILAADIAGYSRLMGADEEGTHAALKAIRRELGDPMIAEHRGRIFKSTGDGLLAEFTSVVDAVRCAVELQTAMSGRNAGVVAERRIEFRIGVNVGDVIIDGEDIYGDGVNIAARLEALAEPGGVCISARVHEDVVGKVETHFHDLGEQALKNIGRPVRVYRVGAMSASGGSAPLRRRGLKQAIDAAHAAIKSMTRRGGRAARKTAPGPVRAAETPARPALLVLPFRNATGDPEQEYFTDAVTADLTVDLSRIRDIAVISAASAHIYKDRPVDTRNIGRELGVRYIVLGSIARIAERIRTNVQLVDAATGEQLWGDRFENEFTELTALHDAVTGRVAASLNVQVIRAEGRRAEKSPQPDALDLRLRAASLFFGSIAPEHTLKARQLLQRSLSLDPSSAEAWARLAEVIAGDRLNRWNNTGVEHLREAEAAAHRALEIDPNNALAHVANGLIHRTRGEHLSALESFSRGIELDPNFAFAYAHKGSELIAVGRPAEAPAWVERALRLSPHDPSLGIFYWIAGRAHFFTGQYDEAVDWLHKSVRARPNLWYNRLYLVSAYALLGKTEEAGKALAEFHRRFPEPGYTLAVVRRQEGSNPNSNPVVVGGRERFHEGLRRAGMAEA